MSQGCAETRSVVNGVCKYMQPRCKEKEREGMSTRIASSPVPVPEAVGMPGKLSLSHAVT